MKNLLLVLTILMSSMVFADENTVETNIGEGHVTVSGGFGMGYSNYNGASIHLYPSAEYFITDRFSLGGSVYGSFNKNDKSFGIGPSLTYYFWQKEKWAAYAGSSIRYDTYHSTYSGSSYTFSDLAAEEKVGLNYFVTPSVAFGPQLNYTRELTSNSSYHLDNFNNMALNFNFSIIF